MFQSPHQLQEEYQKRKENFFKNLNPEKPSFSTQCASK
jgi:hypothetical protein